MKRQLGYGIIPHVGKIYIYCSSNNYVFPLPTTAPPPRTEYGVDGLEKEF